MRLRDEAMAATRNIDTVYALAADMGGMGFISANHATILYNNSLINLHTIEAARRNGVSRYMFSSSACIYPDYLQTDNAVKPLREEDAFPAQPQDAYGWEKLVSELLCRYYSAVALDPADEPRPARHEVSWRGQSAVMIETDDSVEIVGDGRVSYRWRKGSDWASIG